MSAIVVIIGAAASRLRPAGLPGESSVLDALLREAEETPRVTLISLGFGRSIEGLAADVDLSGAKTPLLDRVLGTVGVGRLRDRLSTFPLGRLINSIGPLDQGRVFWRLVRRSPEALRALREADIAVAADHAGVKTAWLALRRGWVRSAHYDHRAIGLGVTIILPGTAPRD